MTTVLEALRDRRRILQNPYAFAEELDEIESRKRDRLRLENPYAHDDDVARLSRPVLRFDGIASGLHGNGQDNVRRRAKRDLQKFVRELQVDLWTNREALFGTRDVDPVAVLDPAIVLQRLGYNVVLKESLGRFATVGGAVEVAATINQREKLVEFSGQFNLASRNFTLAHELAHALLHETVELHRDRAVDGGSGDGDVRELEANQFAKLFLMPEKLIRRVLEENVGFAPVRVNTNGMFAGKKVRGNLNRAVARELAKMTRANGRNFASLAERFRVSIETMAIRLEELNLFVLSDVPTSGRT